MQTTLVTGCLSKLVDRCGQVRTVADNSGYWVSLEVGGHLADRCEQVWTILVTGCLSNLVEIWRTVADKFGYWVSL